MHQRALAYLAVLVFLLSTTTFAGATVNKSIHIDEGETVDRKLSSVNGSINVGSRAELQRSAETVNGTISVDEGASTRDLTSVNGTLRVGDGVTVDGDIRSVNGTIRSGEKTVVTGGVETVNGSVELRETTVQKDLRTINGRVVLDQGSRVQGNLIVEETSGRNWGGKRKPLEIELRGGSVIEGDVEVRDGERQVRIRLSGGSAVMGQVRGAEVIEE